MKNKIFILLSTIIISLTFTGCDGTSTVTVVEEPTKEEPVIVYEAMLYNNHGDNFLNFEGNNFNISPNKVKQYGWNSGDGSWTYWYDTSSVVTIEIDGNYIQSCGSTVIFKDTRLNMLEIPSEFNTRKSSENDGYSVTEDGQYIDTYYGLQNWWYDIKEKGQHGKKIILIQSQDGYNIGAFIGNDVTWEVSEKLPKTTLIMIDGLPLYIHRCNFTIIDSEFINNSY